MHLQASLSFIGTAGASSFFVQGGEKTNQPELLNSQSALARPMTTAIANFEDTEALLAMKIPTVSVEGPKPLHLCSICIHLDGAWGCVASEIRNCVGQIVGRHSRKIEDT